MTTLTLVVSWFLALSTQQAHAIQVDCDTNDLAVHEQIKKLDCELRDIAKHINDGDEVVPKIIHHFGKRKYMDENVAARTIPQEAWDKFIMGENTRFSLAENRRGLYGTAGIDTNGFGSGEYNWLIEIHIKDECRRPENVVTLIGLPKSERFKKWFQGLKKKDRAGFENLESFSKSCYSNSTEPLSDYDGKFMGKSNCAKLVDFYFKDSKAKVVQDHVIRKAFFIRDRSCIETIKGTPEETLEFAAKRDILWLEPCNAYLSASRYLKTIVLKALAESKEVPTEALLSKLKANFALAKLPSAEIDAYTRCNARGETKSFADALASGMYGSMPDGWKQVCQ